MSDLQTFSTTQDAELEALAPHTAWAFGDTPSGSLDWLKRARESGRVRIARSNGAVVGGLVEVPMGQWFGARSVRTLGLAGVAIAPEVRGEGVALELIQQTLRAAREQGFALSTLYPSTFGLYRKAGYELAGSHCRVTLQLRRLTRARRPLKVQPLAPERQAELATLYTEVARQRSGWLDRGSYIWERVRAPRREPARGFGVSDAQGLAGYVFIQTTPSKGMPLQLSLSDFVARTPEAYESLLCLLADHLTTAETASWHGGPQDARVLGLPERVAQVALEDYWMLRLVDVRAALLGRGYRRADAAVELVVEDAFLPENSGRHRLVVEAGHPRLDGGGELPPARLSAGSLAALYTGFASPHELRLLGKLDAGERALDALELLFSGPAPGLADFF